MSKNEEQAEEYNVFVNADGSTTEWRQAGLLHRSGDLPALERDVEDELQQLGALVGCGAHPLRVPSIVSAMIFVCSSLVPSPNSRLFASISSRPISYSDVQE